MGLHRREHAVVLGASMSGLLQARVLADCYERVTVVERDDVASAGDRRRGVPQAQHTHGLLGRGRQDLERLFPGLTAELVASGAVLVDQQAEIRWHNDGHLLEQTRSGLQGIAQSRSLLERAVRDRVLALDRVELLAPCELLGMDHESGRVTGVRVRAYDGSEQRLAADLVVDATGRGSHTPAWLKSIGCTRPQESTIGVGLGYVTFCFPWERGDLDGDACVIVGATIERPRPGAALRQEGDRWIVTLGGYDGDHPPTDLASFKKFARTLPAPDIADLIALKEALGKASTYRFQSSRRRHYEKLRDFPAGLIVVGDAMCSFNPIYGQGMTVAAAQALDLQEALAGDDERLARRFFRRASRTIQAPWDIAAGSDLRIPVVVGPRPLKVRAVNAYVARVQAAAAHDVVVGRALLDVANLLASPQNLLRPAIARRVFRRHVRSRPVIQAP